MCFNLFFLHDKERIIIFSINWARFSQNFLLCIERFCLWLFSLSRIQEEIWYMTYKTSELFYQVSPLPFFFWNGVFICILGFEVHSITPHILLSPVSATIPTGQRMSVLWFLLSNVYFIYKIKTVLVTRKDYSKVSNFFFLTLTINST